MTWNIGSAILIIGVLYLRVIYNIDFYLSGFLIILAVLSWAYPIAGRDAKKLIQAKTRYWTAKAINEENKSK